MHWAGLNNLSLQRYRNLKIRVCEKDSNTLEKLLLLFLSKINCRKIEQQLKVELKDGLE